MRKTYLLAPGPTPLPPEVLAAMSQPLIHHRTPAFQSILTEVEEGLRHLFQTQEPVLTLAASGTGGMEAVVANLFCRGDSVLVIHAGKFGERWMKIARAFGLNPHEIRVERGRTLDLAELDRTIAAQPSAKAVLFQASETSTGVELPTREIAARARKAGMLSVCDAITACGVSELPMDAWGIDAMITGSQKALMVPPGLCFVALSPQAWKAQARSDLPKFYFDLAKERSAQTQGLTAWTPATTLVLGLQASLRLLRQETLEQVYARHARLARATRAGVRALGLELFAEDSPSTAVTAVRVPSSITDGKAIPRLMRDQHGVTIAGGQDELEGKIFRLSHFGYVGDFDVTTALASLELTLAGLGQKIEFGRGVGAALAVLAEKK